ncbi:B3 domain-containing protein REM20-like [Impatiens glandulifera]|uniref:B3 domain-containing protein REM20-like n=1 Tax=Impatiens glandulifera TaxID=253017 RepID=UPI001FB0AD6B|nr:B3 domain-containing protein REM20-like [Impatiens glandulifera]
MNLSRQLEFTPRFSSFFKFYLGHISSNTLQIPTGFVAQMRGLVPKKCILRNDRGKCWRINVGMVGQDMFFTKGWSVFVLENSLEDGHLLVFYYDGEMTFNFTHYDHSACEVEEEEEEESKSKGGFGQDKLEEEEEITPENPFFVTKLQRKKPNGLHVPADMMRNYGIKLPSTVLMIDQEGRQIYTEVVTWTDGRTRIVEGWKLFVRNNNLSEEDRCICEIVVNDDEPPQLKVNLSFENQDSEKQIVAYIESTTQMEVKNRRVKLKKIKVNASSTPSTPLDILTTSANEELNEKRVKKRRKTREPDVDFKTRTSPLGLHYLVKNLFEEQKDVVRDIGFGSLLSLDISKCPMEFS